ncbi:MAG: RDD family protein [Chitinophagaceae bacterium]|nr:RDD family protein [Chitinophagaceae bacterium]
MSQVSVSTPFNIYLEFEVAPFLRRLLAWVLDLVLLLLYAWFMRFFLHDVVFDSVRLSLGVDFLVVSLPMLFYHPLMEIAYQGQSLGKRAMGIRVISIEGGEPRLGQYLMRWIFRVWEWPLFFGFLAENEFYLLLQVFATLFLGLFVVVAIAVSNRSQRLGDLAAGSTVVDLRYKYSIDDTLFRDIQDSSYQVRYPQVMRLSDRDINAIRSVIAYTRKNNRYDTAHRVADKVRTVLGIVSDGTEVVDFLERLLGDYNFLATKDQ